MKYFIAVILSVFFVYSLDAQTTYTVSSNTNWSGVFPSYCNTCTFNISSGVTLTLNTNATCYNCTINGGIVTLSTNFTFQQSAFKNTTVNLGGNLLNLQNNGTSFLNAVVNATGASTFLPTGTISISGSTFNFSGTSEFHNNGGTLNISASNFYFYGNSFFNITAGPVNLSANSQIVAGDGTKASKAYLLINGPVLNLVDAGSALYAANVNNYYANWGAYKSLSNSKTYTTSGNGKNCGGTGQNACSAQFFYGCASFSNLGPVTCTALAASMGNFKAVNSNNGIRLSWSAADLPKGAYFIVEHSSDAFHFSPLITLQQDNLNDMYSYMDASPAAGENAYRICLVIPDGMASYSKVIFLESSPSAAITIYPNPAIGGHFFVQTPSTEPVGLTLYNMQGQVLLTRQLSGQLKYTIPIPQMTGRQLLVVHIYSKDKTTNFSLLNIP